MEKNTVKKSCSEVEQLFGVKGRRMIQRRTRKTIIMMRAQARRQRRK